MKSGPHLPQLAFLDKPKTEKHNAHGAGNSLRFGLSSMQGWRVEMEDAHTAVLGLPHGLPDWSFFAVYDGHAGSRVANYCSKHLLEHIISASLNPPATSSSNTHTNLPQENLPLSRTWLEIRTGWTPAFLHNPSSSLPPSPHKP